MKVKKILMILATTAVLSASAIGLVGCGHKHSFGTELKSDATNHWYECECGEKKDSAAHQASAVYSSDETNHWKECSACGYDLSLEAHNYNQEVATDDYLKTAATATTKAVYYKSCVCGKAGTETFETDKTTATITNLVMTGKTYDGTAVSAPTYDKNSEGAATVEYKVKNANDNTYTTTAPIDAGEYTVRVTIAETSTHTSVSLTKDFTIAKATINIGDIDVELANKTYDGNPINEPMYVVDAFVANADKVVEYKVKGADDSAYTKTAPTDAGEYTVRVKINDSANYNGATKTADFTIEKATASVTSVAMSANSIVYGDSYEVMVEKENYDGEVIIEYKAKNADDATYEMIKPVNAGEYTARVTLQEGANNTGDVETINFAITPKVLDDLYEVVIQNGESEFTFDLSDIEAGLSVRITFEDSSAGANVTNVVILKEGNFCANYAVDLDECYFAILSNVIMVGQDINVLPGDYTINLVAGTYVIDVTNKGTGSASGEVYSKLDQSTPVFEFNLNKPVKFTIPEMGGGEYIVKITGSTSGYITINEHNAHETIDEYGFCQTCGEFAGVVADTNSYVELIMATGDKAYFRFDISGDITDPDLKLNIDFEDEVSVTYTAYDDNGNVIDLTTDPTSFVATESVYVVIEALQDIDTMVQVEQTY